MLIYKIKIAHTEFQIFIAGITETSTQSADLRYAESNVPGTAWGYYPSSSPEGGDAWFNNSSGWYNSPVVGNYAWLTIMHETGHLVGLKHPHEVMGSFAAAPANVDSLEYSVMSYRSYTGASTTQGLTNATWSFPTTLMLYDIAALQRMYGANYTTNNGDTVYKWNPSNGQESINGVTQAAPGGNTILMTIWDGGGNDTYDFSNYATNLSVNLQPGAWTTTATAQLANLGAGHTAIGNIANAYLYSNNPASLIDNAVGGSGNDTIIGNAADNKLTGSAGNDVLDGVSGTDTAVYSGLSTAYQVSQNADGTWTATDLRAGSPDGTDTLKNIELLQFSDKTVAIGAVTPPPAIPSPSISLISSDSASVGDGITNATVLTLTGAAAANSTIKIYVGATLLGSATANAAGAWNFATSALSDGTHSFTATATDTSGNTSTASNVMSVIVDTVAPIAPTVSLQSVDSGAVGDGITNVNVISLTGVAEINSTIKVYDGGTLLGSAIANAEGVWNFVADLTDDQIAALATAQAADATGAIATGSTSNSSADASGVNTTQAWGFTTGPMPDGTHSFTVTSTDAAGNTSAASSSLAVTIDTIAPDAPIIASDAIVNSNQVLLTGTAEANSKVTIFEGTTQLGTATANASGAWNYTTGPLPGGAHAFTATATDVAGNTSLVSQPIDPTIKTLGLIESNGSTSLTEVGNNYFLYDSAGSGPSLKFGSAAVVDGQFGAWTPIGAEQTASGYEVAWRIPGTDTYTVWNTDSNGKYISDNGRVSGTSLALQSLENSFHQDLNGDGHIGPSTTVIDAFGSTSLTEVGNNYFLYDSAGSGPSLKFGSAAVVDGQFGAWTPIGAEQTASGYEVAWRIPGTDTYTVWNTDSNGKYISDNGRVSGTSLALQSLENSFHQDLNGDGHIGPSTTVIDAFGSTSLTEVGNNYFLYDSAGSGPSLKFGSAAVVDGQFGAWTPIGAEQTASGYEVAWRIPGTDTYTVWNTDSNGKYISDNGRVSGTSLALQSLENSFHQDLNGDGHIGPSTTVIDAFGSTSLTEVGNNYFLYDSAGSGPSLKFGSAAVVDGQFGAWTPIGAEQTASGYEVAWRIPGTDTYTVWNTDSNGKYISDNGRVSGTSLALQSLENSFHQDLNGDGHIGPSTTVIDAFGSTSLTEVGNNYFLYDSAGSGPSLKFGSAAVVDGQFGAWTPIGAEQTASGYEVAWRIPGTDTYTVWNTDSNGKYISDNGHVSGTSSTLESLETSFHQDLNGDVQIGPIVGSQTLTAGSDSTALTVAGANAGSANIVDGTTGNDTITSSAANEIFSGNGGINTFVFSGNIGKDTIADFQASNDAIQLSHNAFTSVADVFAHAAQVGTDVTITIDSANSVTLHNTVLSHLTTNNFHLA